MSGNGKDLILKLKESKKRLMAIGAIPKKNDVPSLTEKEIPFSIPDSWSWARLSDVSLIQEGPGIRKHQYTAKGIQFLTVTNILDGGLDMYKSQKYISKEEFHEKYSHFKINIGDIVSSCSGATWGKTAIFDFDNEIILNTSTLRLRYFDDIGDNRFLYYLTKADFFKNQLKSHQTGQQPNYGFYHYSLIAVPVPPLSEQQKIVERLDAAFALIDRAKAKLEQNLQNAKELFQSKLNEVFSQKGEGWEERKLGEVSNFDKIKNTKDLPYVGLENIESNSGRFLGSFENFKVKSDTFYFNENHILYGRLRPYLNKVLIPDFEGHCSTEIFPIKINQQKVLRGFLYHWLMSSNTVEAINATCTGARMPRANMNEVLNFEFSFPTSLESQQKIVSQLDALSAQTDLLQQKYTRKLASLEELRKSVLERAFRGNV